MKKEMGVLFIVIGVIFLIVGVIIYYFKGIPFLGKLPGDFSFKKGNFSFYFPLASSIIISIILSLILYLISRFR